MSNASRLGIAAMGVLLAAGGFWAGRWRADHPAPAPTRKILFYRNPMDPTIRSEVPAKDSMGMDFIPVYEDQAAPGPSVAGRASLTLSPERRRLLGVRSAPVTRAPLTREIRTVGRVTYDESRLRSVFTKVSGWVERLYANTTGQLVKEGEPLLSIYSPELVATQQEYLLAWRARERLAQSGIASVAKGGADLLEAARQRLLFFDIRPEDIDRLGSTGEVKRTLDLYAEISGYVVQKNVFHGMRVMPADTLFDIADLSRLTPRERAYIEAARVLYAEGDQRARRQAYAAAMEDVHRAYPEDDEATTLYALALDGSVRARSRDALPGGIRGRLAAVQVPHAFAIADVSPQTGDSGWLVAAGAGETPMLPIPAGTNNAFAEPVEPGHERILQGRGHGEFLTRP